MAKFIWFNILPNGKSVKGYGTHRVDQQPLAEDWAVLFRLLEEGQIQPILTETFPLLEAAKANALLESGQVTGNIVLLAPELP
jgi:NADPH:quinone reductase-like Zn-dependent oxidoreductase